jgi:hypothetical protein
LPSTAPGTRTVCKRWSAADNERHRAVPGVRVAGHHAAAPVVLACRFAFSTSDDMARASAC